MICFDHGVEYDGVDVLMCPDCEGEICREHDEALALAEFLAASAAAYDKGEHCSIFELKARLNLKRSKPQ